MSVAVAQIAVIDGANLDKRQEDEQHSTKSDEAKKDETDKKKSVVCTYSNKYRSQMFRRSPAEALQRDAGNVKMIRYYAQKYGVPEGLALSVAYQESRFDTCAGSHTGVKGVMQLTKGTGKSMGLDRDVNEQNVEGGVKYLGMGVKQCGATNYSCLASFYNGSDAAEQRGWAGGVGRWNGYFNDYVSSGKAPAAAPPPFSIVTADGAGGTAQGAAMGAVRKAAGGLDASSSQMGANDATIDALAGNVGQVTEYKDAWELNSSARGINADVTNQYLAQAGDFTALLAQLLSLQNVHASQSSKLMQPPKSGSPNPLSCDPAELERLKIDRRRSLRCAVENAAASSADSRSTIIASDPAGAASVIDSLQQ
ncbi:transglycosylase SLT domain-containing protein [Mesorhizobium sp. LjNodule214]|uniref:transglycosylase SLT domain-containing protein n=1 Tax=Mesorhizobium sp. LjNodule214 TaxID=3342252 RepID=UPI003ED0AE58